MKKKSNSLLLLLVILAVYSFVIANGCISGTPTYLKLFPLDDKIFEENLVKANVDEHLRIKVIFYDECDNITDVNFSIDKLGVVFEPEVKDRVKTDSFHYNISQSSEGVFIDLDSTLAVKHKLIISYFSSNTYYVKFNPGKASNNSILEVDKNVITIGETVTVYIIPYDQYENLIDANIYNYSNTPFKISYNDVLSNESIVEKFDIVNIVNHPLIFYNIKLIQEGEIIIKGKVGNVE